ncbi:MAG: cation diffusion facilitator family transporter [Pseudomonas sp.]
MSRRTGPERLLRQATLASLSVASILIVAKGVAWWLSGSVSLLAGLTDSLLDGAASLLNLLAVHYALRPADEDHRYGHGKAEALSGMAQALFIAVSAVLVAIQAIEHLQHPQPLGAPGLGIAVMLLSLGLTIVLLLFQQHVIRVTGSTAIRADSLHYRSDLLLNGSILLALVLAYFGWEQLDGLFGLGIAVYILWSAVRIAREAIAVLMDEELPVDVSSHMLELACGVPGVLGAHDLRTRISGTHWFVQLHLELPGALTLTVAHDLCEQVDQAIRAEYPRAEVLVHADPQDVLTQRAEAAPAPRQA